MSSTIFVNDPRDIDDGDFGNNVTTLREAIRVANTIAGDDVIDLSGITGTIILESALPNISSNIDFIGPGSALLAVDGQNKARPFFIERGRSIFSGLTITNGLAEGNPGQDGGGGGAAGMGGALFINGGLVIIDDVIFRSNEARGGNGGSGAVDGPGFGGDFGFPTLVGFGGAGGMGGIGGEGGEGGEASVQPFIGVSQDLVSIEPDPSGEFGEDNVRIIYEIRVDNFGDEDLIDVQLANNLESTFGSGNFAVVDPPELIAGNTDLEVNPDYDGSTATGSDIELLIGGTLPTGGFSTFQLTVDVSQEGATEFNTSSDFFFNETDADARGAESGLFTGDTASGEDVVLSSAINVFEELISSSVTPDGAFGTSTIRIVYEISVENIGIDDLSNVQLVNSLEDTFGNGNFEVMGQPELIEGSSSLEINPEYDGEGDTNLLSSGGTLSSGDSSTFEITVDVDFASETLPGSSDPGFFFNQTTATAIGSTSDDVIDFSNDVEIFLGFSLGASQEVISSTIAPDGIFGVDTARVVYEITVENIGIRDISDVQLTNNLEATFGFNNFVIVGTPTLTGGNTNLQINPDYDGNANGDLNLLIQSGGILPVEDSSTFQLTVDVNLASETLPSALPGFFENQTIATNIDPSIELEITDFSNNGDIDINNNRIANESEDPNENNPTFVFLDIPPVITSGTDGDIGGISNNGAGGNGGNGGSGGNANPGEAISSSFIIPATGGTGGTGGQGGTGGTGNFGSGGGSGGFGGTGGQGGTGGSNSFDVGGRGGEGGQGGTGGTGGQGGFGGGGAGGGAGGTGGIGGEGGDGEGSLDGTGGIGGPGGNGGVGGQGGFGGGQGGTGQSGEPGSPNQVQGTGSISGQGGETALSGIRTLFLNEIDVGDSLVFTFNETPDIVRTVTSIDSDQGLTVDQSLPFDLFSRDFSIRRTTSTDIGGSGGGGGGAGFGGAVFIRSGELRVTNSSFENNTAQGGNGTDGGQSGIGVGGAIFAYSTDSSVANVTTDSTVAFVGNTATNENNIFQYAGQTTDSLLGDRVLAADLANDELLGSGNNFAIANTNDSIRRESDNALVAGNNFFGKSSPEIFVLAAGEGIDTITDFEVGTDAIGLADGFNLEQLALVQNGGNTLINHGNATLAVVLEVTNLSESSFVMV